MNPHKLISVRGQSWAIKLQVIGYFLHEVASSFVRTPVPSLPDHSARTGFPSGQSGETKWILNTVLVSVANDILVI